MPQVQHLAQSEQVSAVEETVGKDSKGKSADSKNAADNTNAKESADNTNVKESADSKNAQGSAN